MGKKKKDAVDIAAQQRAQEQAEVEQAFLTLYAILLHRQVSNSTRAIFA